MRLYLWALVAGTFVCACDSSGSPSTDADDPPDGAGPDGSILDAASNPADGSSPDSGGSNPDGGVTCEGAPQGSDAEQQAALAAVNAARTAMGVPCVTMVATINQAATAHCAYYVANQGTDACFDDGNPHTEVASCSLFTGAGFGTRMSAAGYAGSPRFEDMAFANDGDAAVAQWIHSVWHRTPVLSPWVRDLGYGHASGCDTMDFARGTTTASTVRASWPHPGQTGVRRSFYGQYEGPTPPAPPSGWPSGYPITLYAAGIASADQANLTHTLVVDGTGTNIPHQWLTPSTHGLLSDAYVLYANAPLAANTTYRVQMSGTSAGGPVTFDFTFTTGN